MSKPLITNHHTVHEIFDCTIKIEQKSCNIYKDFASLFSHIPKVCIFWGGMYKDEKYHLKLLIDIFESLTKYQLSSPVDMQICNNVEKNLDILNNYFISIIENLDDAYEFAHEIEFYKANIIINFLTCDVISNEELKILITSIINQHQQKLINFNDNFGDRAWRKRIVIKITF